MKKRKIEFLILLLAFVSSFSVQAQMGMGKIEEIEAVQSRKLIVMIEEPREKMLKKIEKRPKRGSVEDYKADLKVYNANIKEVVEKFWPYDKTNIQYKTYKELEALRKSGSKEYAVLVCLSTEARSTSAGYNFYDGLYWVKDIKDDFEDRDDGMFTVMLVNVIEDFGKRPVFYIPLYDIFPTKASLVYGVTGIGNYFNTRIATKKNGGKMKDERERAEQEMAIRAPKLAEKTLLIREEWLDKELTADNLKNYYPYKYKVCDRAFMDEVVMSQDDKYAYAVELPYVISGSNSNSVMYLQFVIDAKDNQAVCLVKPSTGSMMLASGVTGKAGTRNFTIKTMTKIVEQIKGTNK
jgi:hypothetical protein